MREATFTLSELGVSSKGYTNGSTWNGFACPWFTKEQAIDLMDQCNAHEAIPDIIIFDEEQDRFVDFEYGELVDEDAYSFATCDIDGMHLYAFGDGWIWEEVE